MMSATATEVLTRALRLPARERAEIAGRLIDSLEGPSEENVEAAWAVEIARRIEQLDAGQVTTVPWSEARETIRGGLGG
jgi:putative addiction module component (TIGR02574 family)